MISDIFIPDYSNVLIFSFRKHLDFEIMETAANTLLNIFKAQNILRMLTVFDLSGFLWPVYTPIPVQGKLIKSLLYLVFQKKIDKICT